MEIVLPSLFSTPPIHEPTLFNAEDKSHSPAPGHGSVVYQPRGDGQAGLTTLSFAYPLQLIVPTPEHLPADPVSDSTTAEEEPSDKSSDDNNDTSSPPPGPLIHTIFILSYGGGLVPADQVNLHVDVCANARLVLLTQGSTKVFKCLDPVTGTIHRTGSHMTFDVRPTGAIVYLPDPVQPFASSSFDQTQTYRLHGPESNVCVCDWVCQGRISRGECWDIYSYSSRNEFWAVGPGWGGIRLRNRPRILLRDNIHLSDPNADGAEISARLGGMAVFGSLIIAGPMFAPLSRFFITEFNKLPQIGAQDWGSDTAGDKTSSKPKSGRETWRGHRLEFEKQAGIVWTTTTTRGFTIVKFSAPEVEPAREWLNVMLLQEGSLMAQFGHRPFFCLKSQ